MTKNKIYEMADSDDPKGIIMASQAATIALLKTVLAGVRSDLPDRPGLTWEQIDGLLDLAAKKEPKIIYQEEPM